MRASPPGKKPERVLLPAARAPHAALSLLSRIFQYAPSFSVLHPDHQRRAFR